MMRRKIEREDRDVKRHKVEKETFGFKNPPLCPYLDSVDRKVLFD